MKRLPVWAIISTIVLFASMLNFQQSCDGNGGDDNNEHTITDKPLALSSMANASTGTYKVTNLSGVPIDYKPIYQDQRETENKKLGKNRSVILRLQPDLGADKTKPSNYIFYPPANVDGKVRVEKSK